MKPTYFDEKTFNAYLGNKARYIWCIWDRLVRPGVYGTFKPSIRDLQTPSYKVIDLMYVKRVDDMNCQVDSLYDLAPFLSVTGRSAIIEAAYFFKNSQKALNMTREEIQRYVMYLKLQGVVFYPPVL